MEPIFFAMGKIFLILGLFFVSPLFGQKEDHVWVFGYDYLTDINHPGAERIVFTFDDSLKLKYSNGPMILFDTYGSICDSNGNLLLLSNGCFIENGTGEKIPDSDGLNPGKLYDVQCLNNQGYNTQQSMMLLPDPHNKLRYHLFHIPTTIANGIALDYGILHSIVDLSLNNNEGGMIVKNDTLVLDLPSNDGMHAVRHANGRDWWILGAQRYSNLYYTFLLTQNGIQKSEQLIGDSLAIDASGEMCFSPDGSKFARFDCKNGLHLFDFDRCSGILSNPVSIPHIQDGTQVNNYAGLAWSADGRFLYMACGTAIYQIDMTTQDLAASRQLVLQYDPNNYCFLNSTFLWMELGPDGVIYCRPGNGTKCMNRINHPERAGIACAGQQKAFSFDYAYKNIPHFPNFRLGPIDGSACDTLGINNIPLAGWRYERPAVLTVDFTSVSWYEPTQWYWTFGDGATSTDRNPQHVYDTPGPYPVCLTVSNANGSDTKCKTVWVTTTATDAPVPAYEERVFFPNPSSGVVSWSGPAEGLFFVSVYNTLGECVLQMKTAAQQVDLSGFPAGLYHIRLLQEGTDKMVVGKVILE